MKVTVAMKSGDTITYENVEDWVLHNNVLLVHYSWTNKVKTTGLNQDEWKSFKVMQD